METTALNFRDIVVIIHALSASVGIGTVFATDYIFIKFLKNHRVSQDQVRIMKIMSEVIWIALGALILSGIYLAATKTGITDSPKFLLKMTVVIMTILNGLLLNIFVMPRLHKIAFHVAHTTPDDEPDHVRKIAMVTGGVSVVSWLLAFILGSIHAIPFSLSNGLTWYFGILIAVIIGASLTKKKHR
ncbi:MAG: hypothetical protein RL641_745 [Candidatus Parcubacteria bacterium]|jgi:uncharacterized protein YneF (UPF0154 family)